MTIRLVWLEKAQQDLIHIKSYYTGIAGKSGSAKILQRIISSAKLLQQYQHIGHVLEDDDISERKAVIRGYDGLKKGETIPRV